jgi:hypothetical protein
MKELRLREERVKDMREAGQLTRDELDRRLGKIKLEMQKLEATVPEPVQAEYDADEVILAIASLFVGFRNLEVKQQRELLRGAVRKIRVNGREGITSVTLSGGFLGSATAAAVAKSDLPSRPPYWRPWRGRRSERLWQ